MPELGPSGSVRGALSNERPYRDTSSKPRKGRCAGHPTATSGKADTAGEMSEDDAQSLHRGTDGSTYTRKARATREAPKRGQVRDGRTNRTPARDRPGALGWRRGS
jgi:hypothetical protein